MEKDTVWDLIGDRQASLCVQAILEAVKDQKGKLEKVVECIIPDKAEDIHQAINHYIACHTFEAAIKLASQKKLAQVFKLAFQAKLMEFANQKYSTFIVQTFISSVQSTNLFQEILCEFDFQKLAQLFDNGKGGVLLCLVEKARQLNCESILSTIVDMVNFWGQDQGQGTFKAVAPLLMTRNTRVSLDQVVEGSEDKTLSYLGCALLASIFKFNQNDIQSVIRPFVQSLSELAKEKVVRVAKDKFGSRVIEAFFEGKNVDGNQKRKVSKKLKGSFVELALSAPGSFVVEAVFGWGEIKLKREIANELIKCVNDLDQDRCGIRVSQKLDLKGFYEDKKAWEGRIKFQESMKFEIDLEFGQKQTGCQEQRNEEYLQKTDKKYEEQEELPKKSRKSKVQKKINEQEAQEEKISQKEEKNKEKMKDGNIQPIKQKRKRKKSFVQDEENQESLQGNGKSEKQKSSISKEIYNQLSSGSQIRSTGQKVKKKKLGDDKVAFEEGLNLVQSVLF
eukprot:TRINITY_DN2175_c0_g1_i1.p1 TRINITY_DN2175_c0_g1~~TRINITY_DN2175_c0_g1_i1.p1  ORF type:complete len:506 (-),score=91.15 TRINITY_DN2175_c0_g1_i1:133-1650(-)